MQVIEVTLVFNKKNDSDKINSLTRAFVTNNQSIEQYRKSIKSKWNKLANNIKSLARNKVLIGNDSYSERNFYMFVPKSTSCINKEIEISLIILSEQKNIEENIKIVLEKINQVKEKGMKFEINYKSRGKVYIYDSLRKDITGKELYLEIYFSKEKVIEKVKGDCIKVAILLCITMIGILIYNNQIRECFTQLTKSTDETIKLFTNTKIAIIVNLITGLIGTCFIEILLFIVFLAGVLRKCSYKLIFKPDLATECFEEYVRKGTYASIAEGIDDEEIEIDENVINEVR